MFEKKWICLQNKQNWHNKLFQSAFKVSSFCSHSRTGMTVRTLFYCIHARHCVVDNSCCASCPAQVAFWKIQKGNEPTSLSKQRLQILTCHSDMQRSAVLFACLDKTYLQSVCCIMMTKQAAAVGLHMLHMTCGCAFSPCVFTIHKYVKGLQETL